MLIVKYYLQMMTSVGDQRFLRCRPTFSSSLMVSVGLSALRRSDLHFVEAGVKNIASRPSLYHEVFLMQKLLPIIKEFSDCFTFQQNLAPDHRVKTSRVETPDFIPPSLWREGGLQIGLVHPSTSVDYKI